MAKLNSTIIQGNLRVTEDIDINGSARKNGVDFALVTDIPSLSGYATQTWVGNNYLPLSGGTMTNGSISWNSDSHGVYFYNGCGIEKWSGYGPSLVGEGNSVDFWIRNGSDRNINYKIIHEGNCSVYALPRVGWWYENQSHNPNDLRNGITFAYNSTHGTPTTGTLVSFTCSGNDSYPLQLQGSYSGDGLYFRNRNGDNGTWSNWRYVIHSGNISGQSVSYASSAGNADTVDDKHAVDFVGYLGNITGLGSGTTAANTKSYWGSNIGTNRIDMCYNNSGAEYSLLFSKAPSGSYGSVLKWGYTDKYLRILRFSAGNWQSDDWEKMDAGYADTAGSTDYATNAASLDGNGPAYYLNYNNFTNTPSSLPASDVYAWAKSATKPSYDFSEIGMGNIVQGDGSGYFSYRQPVGVRSGFYYQAAGDESVVFCNEYEGSGWMFVNGYIPEDRTNWQNITPTLQIKRGGVVINKLIGQGASPSYSLDVNGTLNATTIYENGTDISSKYLSKSGGTMTGIINKDAGGSWINARDNTLIKTTRTSSEGSDWHPAVGIKTSNGFWSLGSVGGETLCLSYDTDTNYNNNNNNSAVINFPAAGSTGTLALVGDNNHTHSQYLTSHQTVTNNAPVAGWGESVTIGSVGGTALTFTMPSSPWRYRHSVTIVLDGTLVVSFSFIDANSGSDSITYNKLSNALCAAGATNTSHMVSATGQISASLKTRLIVGVYGFSQSSSTTLGFRYLDLISTSGNTATMSVAPSTGTSTVTLTSSMTFTDEVEAC